MKTSLLVIGGVVALVVTGIVIAVGSFAFSWFAAPYQGKLQARQQIQGNGQYRIAAYQSFFQQCAAITTMDQQLKQTLAQEKVDKGSDLSRDRINYGAQLNARDDAANTYNTQAAESYTLGQFRASNLPYSIPAYQKGKVFQCVG